MTRPFDTVEIVFNPNSTGDAQERAQKLADELAERAPELPVTLRPTEHAGHGREPRYAHSYIGLGITPTVALDLEQGGKGSIREVISTIRTFSRFRPFQIDTDAGRESFDSVILANIREMAKFAELSDEGEPDDGRFEVVILRHTAKWRVLATAVRAALRGLGPQPTAREYHFRTVKPMPVQVDGEVADLERGVAVSVEIAPGALRTVR